MMKYRLLGVASLLLATTLTACSQTPLAPAQSRTEITIHDTMVAPENLTSSQDGTVFFSSTTKGTLYRALPGAAQAEAWIQAGATGLTNVLGVLADDKASTL